MILYSITSQINISHCWVLQSQPKCLFYCTWLYFLHVHSTSTFSQCVYLFGSCGATPPIRPIQPVFKLFHCLNCRCSVRDLHSVLDLVDPCLFFIIRACFVYIVVFFVDFCSVPAGLMFITITLDCGRNYTTAASLQQWAFSCVACSR